MNPTEATTDKVYCFQCPEWYDVSKILARSAGVDGDRPWSQVVLVVAPPSRSLFRRRTERDSVAPRSMKDRADVVAAGWKPFCPEGHPLAESLDPPRVIGIIGNVGASKSHYLAALVYELINRQPLQWFGADVSYIADTGMRMKERITKIFVDHEVLGNNERGSIDGPFTYRLTVKQGGEDRRYVLVFFDVAGEDCANLRQSAAFVRYLFDAIGIIVLVDPEGLPDPDNPLRARGDAPITDRYIIDTLADGIEQVTGVVPAMREQTLVIAVAKSDAVSWQDTAWPPEFWGAGRPIRGADTFNQRKALRDHLLEFSATTRAELVRLGGESVVFAAESRFDENRIFYARVSATGESALNGRWDNPHPVGCGIPVAQILLQDGAL